MLINKANRYIDIPCQGIDCRVKIQPFQSDKRSHYYRYPISWDSLDNRLQVLSFEATIARRLAKVVHPDQTRV